MTTTKVTSQLRRDRARLAVLATSALTLAASWVGVAAADRNSEPAQAVTTATPLSAAATVEGVTTLVPAPAATRKVVVVRRSRAS